MIHDPDLLDQLDALPKETFDGEAFRGTRQSLDPLASSFSGGRWMRRDGAGVFQSLLGMAFVALDMAVPELPAQLGEPPGRLMERGMFEMSLAVNRLRNKQGTGHGRPWLPTITDEEAKAAIETVGTVAAYMLAKLAKKSRRP